jgi:rhamnosyltransferase
MKMNISIIGSRGIPAKYGGYELFTQEISKLLVTQGFSVIVAGEYQGPDAIKKYFGVDLCYFPYPAPDNYLFRKVYEILNDIYFMITLSRKSNIMYLLGMTASFTLILPKILNKGLKIMVNIDGLEWKRTKFNMFEKTFLKINTIIGMVLADTIIIDSRSLIHHIPRCFLKKTHFISYGVYPIPTVMWNMTPIETYINEQPLLPHLDPNTFWLVVARLEPENNIHTVIEGFMLSSSVKPLIIVGNFSNNSYKKHIENLVNCKTNVLNGNIHLVGAIYNDNLLNMLRQNCFGYIHGHSVGGTNPSLLEAMIMNNIIMAHDNEFNKEVCGDLALYFSNAKDLKNKIELIEEKYEDFKVWKSLVSTHALKEYSWVDVSEKYKSAFYELMNVK